MSLQIIVIIATRIYAVYWLFQALVGFVTAIPLLLAFSAKLADSPAAQEMSSSIHPGIYLLIPLASLLLAALLWFGSTGLASLVVGKYEREVALGGLNREILYAASLVTLGLCFALGSISTVVHDVANFAIFEMPLPPDAPTRGQYLWPLAGQVLALIAGIICIAKAGTWSRKLARLHESQEETSPHKG